MKKKLPITCELGEPEQRTRETAIRELLKKGADSVSERPSGLAVQFAGDADCLREIADLMSIERKCCRFLRFELSAEPQEGPIELVITGPEGTREFLRNWYA